MAMTHNFVQEEHFCAKEAIRMGFDSSPVRWPAFVAIIWHKYYKKVTNFVKQTLSSRCGPNCNTLVQSQTDFETSIFVDLH